LLILTINKEELKIQRHRFTGTKQKCHIWQQK